jgi:hypothetical protein
VVVRGLSECSADRSASTRPRPDPGPDVHPGRIIIVLAVLVFGLHWIQKSPCQDGIWTNHEQYSKFCYTDVLALYYSEHLNEGAVPYFDWPVEYPC